MKAVITALILIIIAAIILWLGNTLNSWVLGGLIGGLTALLISIPLALFLFFYFSRRQDPPSRYKSFYNDSVSLAKHGYYNSSSRKKHYEDYTEEEEYNPQLYKSRNRAEVLEGEYEEIYDEDDEYEKYAYYDGYDEYRAPLPPSHQLPAPSSTHVPTRKRVTSSHLPEKAQFEISDTTERRSSTQTNTGVTKQNLRTRPLRAGYPGRQGSEVQSRFRSQALRTARLEAAREAEYRDTSFSAPHERPGSQPSEVRTTGNQPASSQINARRPARRVQQSPSQSRRPSSHRPRPRTRSGAFDEEESQGIWPETDKAEQINMLNQQAQAAEEEFLLNEPATDDLNRPLLRRAPYTYEDDPVRQEFSQQIDAPRVRRSSRYLQNYSSDDSN